MTDAATVVVVGGGFGGLEVARELGKDGVSVTLIDRRNHHLFQPLLYQVAMAGLAPSEIAAPIRAVVRKYASVRVVLAEVVGVDLAANQVHLAEGAPVAYSHLVLAPGARTHYFGHPEWEHFAPGLKDLDDAVEIRRRVLLAFEGAEREPEASRRARLLTFVVIGGGPTGVELAGAVAELSRFVLSRDFRRLAAGDARVLLVEGGPRVLSTFAPELSARAERQLADLGVEVRTDTMVENIDAHGVSLRGGERIESETVLWAAGVSASPLLSSVGLKTDRTGRARVGNDCSVAGHSEVFVIGDAAHFVQDGESLPGVSPVAMQMGRHVARCIEADMRDQPRPPFRYVDKGSMATIGRSRAIAQKGKMRLSGFVAWLAWLLVHIWYLIGFRNRLLVLIDWTWSYLTYRRGSRLITGDRMHPGAPPRQGVGASNVAEAPADERR